MSNEQNLKKGNPDTQFKSGQEAVENGRKGGIASGEARRKKKLLSELIDNEFEKDITVKANGKTVTLTKKELAAVRLIRIINDQNTTDKDFLKALEFARDTIGEKPVDKIQNVDIDPEIYEEIEQLAKGIKE